MNKDWIDIIGSIGAIIVVTVLGVGAIFGLFVLMVWIKMLLWNAVVPNLFGWPTITFWRMAGLSLLIGFLFSSGSFTNGVIKGITKK